MYVMDNNVLVTLAADVGVSDASLSVAAPLGINKAPPNPNGGLSFLTLTDNLRNPSKIEVVTYTGRTGTGPYTLTGVTRAQGGTSAQLWYIGDSAYQAIVAENMRSPGMVTPTELFYDDGDVSGTYTPNLALANNHKVNFTGNCTINAPTMNNLPIGHSKNGFIEITASGAHSITWSSDWDFGGYAAPVIDAKMVIGFYRKYGDAKTRAWYRKGFA